ncbi:lipoprotein [Longispora fulva]|uniref:Lysophospholipase L1-like esterase n=1 Tax=Longispora fulva TaxID=619741 RepID=A0A8J7H338_9ACTN|nr:GDSL-type esterase/lipase family protein [Longispora fulva]MBG6140608.1 lysophospholipase L1-like esterase [Longispora fulva]GIG57010.1 lipoprotein [Longispora fulva]
MRRTSVILVVLASLVAIACQSGGNPGPGPGPGPTPKGLPGSMVAIGDSITVAFASCLLPQPCPRNSWSTGDSDRDYSHYERIRALNPAIGGHATNLAVPGARAGAMAGQARAAVATGAEYVTLLVGANDVCRPAVADMTSAADFRAQVDEALRVLKEGLPKAKVFVASIPDVYRLWEVGHGNDTVVRVWNQGVCPSMLANPTSDAAADRARRADVRDRVTAYDSALSSACLKYGRLCDYDGGAVHRYKFEVKDLSPVDFFHPNAGGQQILAEVTWKAGPYA